MKIRTQAELRPVFRAMFEQAQALVACGKQVLIEVGEFKPKRTNDQNAYYWLYCKELADFFNETVGGYGEFQIPYTKDIMHDIHKARWGIDTTTKMTIQEFCNFIHMTQNFWIEKTGGQFQVSELPESYLIRKGYDLERNLK